MSEEKVDLVQRFEKDHISRFDTDFWIHKAAMLKRMIDDKELRDSILGKDSGNSFLIHELFSTKLHCCETLLRIMIIAKKEYFYPLLPLIKLSFPKFQNEFKLMKDNTNAYFDNNFFKSNFYPFKEMNSKHVDEAINFLKEVMPYIIKEYDDHMANNVFKHGFYGSAMTDMSISVENKPIAKSPYAIVWYEITPFEDHHKLHQHNKSISLTKELNIIKIVSSILDQFLKLKMSYYIKKLKKLSVISKMYL